MKHQEWGPLACSSVSAAPVSVIHCLTSSQWHPQFFLRLTMFTPDQYALLDFGRGRRLERFGPWILDRECPTAEGMRRAEDDVFWNACHARFERTVGKNGDWAFPPGKSIDRWTISHGEVTFELKLTDFGHVGLFPEQASNWDWIAKKCRRADTPLRVLNLFAYTGGSTLAAATAGAEVTHVDSARNVVQWARKNAELSGLADAPIRWIGEDALKFVKREAKRGRRYDAVILDPPSYGHGPKGEVWRLSKHLPKLLAACREVLTPTDDEAVAHPERFVLLTCHTPKYDAARLRGILLEAMPSGRVHAEGLFIAAEGGRRLPSGVMARWEAASGLMKNSNM